MPVATQRAAWKAGGIESDRAEADSRWKLAAATVPSMHGLQVAVLVPADARVHHSWHVHDDLDNPKHNGRQAP